VILARTINEVSKILIFNMRDERDNSFGIMRSNLQPKPAYNYYKKTIEMLGTKRISQWFDLDNNSKFYIFADGGGAVAAVWNSERSQITGFHVNADGMHCFDMAGHDISSSVILAWNGGDTTLAFGQRPIFCQLDGYRGAQKESSTKVAAAQVAGVTANAILANDILAKPSITGTLQGFLNGPIKKGQVIAYQKTQAGWKKFSQEKIVDSSYSLDLPEGQYYLAYESGGFISSRSQPFGVAGESDINLQTTLFDSWLAIIVLAGGVLMLILLIVKYSRKRT